MMKALSVLAFSTAMVTVGWSDYVEITNLEGSAIEVQLVSVEDGEVAFEMRNGREYEVALDTLSADSRKRVKKWAEEANKVVLTPEDRIKVFVHTRKSSKDTDGGYSGWRDMDERVQPRVVIMNNEANRSFNNLEGTLVMIGEDVTDKDNLKVLYKDTFTMSVERRDKAEWDGTPFKLDYLVDDNDSYDNSHGFRYRYYFVVLRNEDGSLGHVTASLSKWERNPERIDQLRVDQICNRDLR